MKLTVLTLMLALYFTHAKAQCDIGTTGIAVVNATNTAPVLSGCVGQVYNFKFTIANYGSAPDCELTVNTVKVYFDFPTISGGIKPYIYNGPLSFNTGYFSWTYDSFYEQLVGINTTAIPFGEGDADILVQVIGNAAGTASSPLNISPGPNSNNTNNDYTSVQFVVNPQPVVSWSALTNQCVSATSYTLPAGSPSGGTYSGTGVTGNIFNPSAAGAGSHVLSYTYSNSSGCSNTANNTITVFALPVVSAGSYGPVCSNGGLVTLNGSPGGGTWNGTGVVGNTFNPAVGTQNLTYTYSDVNGCSDASSTVITVNNPPGASISNDNGLALTCSIPSTTLTATGNGAFLWSTGATTASITVKTAGTFTVTVTGENGCIIYGKCNNNIGQYFTRRIHLKRQWPWR